jgi:hypothetical protein
VCAKFPRVFSAERERVGWIDTAGDHAHQCFVFYRLRPPDLLQFQDFGCTILVRDDRFHHWLFVGACRVNEQQWHGRNA